MTDLNEEDVRGTTDDDDQYTKNESVHKLSPTNKELTDYNPKRTKQNDIERYCWLLKGPCTGFDSALEECPGCNKMTLHTSCIYEVLDDYKFDEHILCMGCANKRTGCNSSVLGGTNSSNDAAFLSAVDPEKRKDDSTSVFKDDADSVLLCGQLTEKNPVYEENSQANIVAKTTNVQSHTAPGNLISFSRGYRRIDGYTESNTTGVPDTKPVVDNNKTVYGGLVVKLKRQEDNAHTCYVCSVTTPTYIVYGDGKEYCYDCFDWNNRCPLYVPIWIAEKCSMPGCKHGEYITKLYTCNGCNVRNVHKDCQDTYWTGSSSKPHYYCYNCVTDTIRLNGRRSDPV